MKYIVKLLVLSVLLTFVSLSTFAQNADVDLNLKYRYPFSFSIDYRSVSPAAQFGTNYGGDYLTTDLAATAAIPLPFAPTIQPFIRGGYVGFAPTDQNDVNLVKFTNMQIYGMGGLFYKHHFSKQVELGIGASGGASIVYYNNLLGDGKTYGQYNFLAQVDGVLGLNISYNINLSFMPALRYTFNITPGPSQFNGFSFILGVGVNYRFGEDPDAPQAEFRSIKADKLDFPAVFAPMQSFYSKNPITTISLVNTENTPLTDVEISFFQAGFMDTPTKAASIAEIMPEETVEIEVPAIYNQQIFTTEGITPLTGEIIVEYKNNGRLADQTFPVSYDLYDKESLTWDDDRKVGAFITPSDSALRNYSSFIRQTSKDYTVNGFSQELQTAMQIYYALKELGVLYQRDPTSPFEAAQEDPLIVDSVSLPRNTLKRATGDCDDLTVLFNSLLESVGIETGFITTPGHIYIAFKTSTAPRDYRLIHPEKEMTMSIDGELWVPIEITLIAETDFQTAWRTGIEEFAAYENTPEKRSFNKTRKSQEIYRPVVLTEKDLGLQYGDRTKIARDFKAELDKSIAMIIEDFENVARTQGSKGSYNRLGITSARLGIYNKAEQAFNSALAIDRNYLPPKINLGNVYFMKGEYQNALRLLHSVEKSIIEAEKTSTSSYSSVLLSISKCYYELENFDKANEYIQILTEIDPEAAAQNSYLSTGNNGERASDRSTRRNVIFADE